MAQPRTPSPQPVNPLDALHQQAQKAKEDRERQIETLRARREAVEEERRKLADVQGHYDSKHARELQAINDEEQKLGAAVPTPPPPGPSQTPAPAPAGQPSDPDDSFSEVDKEKLQALLQDVPLADALLILGKSEAEVRQGLNIPDDQKLTTQLMLVHLSDDHESRLGRLEEITGIKPHAETAHRDVTDREQTADDEHDTHPMDTFEESHDDGPKVLTWKGVGKWAKSLVTNKSGRLA
jgi:hypothetical protein